MSMIIGNVDENDSFDRRERVISPGFILTSPSARRAATSPVKGRFCISPHISQSASRGHPVHAAWRSGPHR